MGLKGLFKGKNSGYRQDLYEAVGAKSVPGHVAIIMDGNGRWANLRNLPRTAGHHRGVETLRGIIRTSSELGIRYLTLYAFSTENWKRPKSEVRYLMSLIVEFLQKEIEELNENGVKIHMLGQLEELPADAGKEIRKAMETTRRNKGLQVNIAINYGSRMEITLAARSIAEDVSHGRLSAKDIDEEKFSHYLETDGIPDPDLLIRTGGEYRLSNFLLFQSAYTELIFTRKDLYWPDFTRDQYLKALIEYQKRVRKFGGIKRN